MARNEDPATAAGTVEIEKSVATAQRDMEIAMLNLCAYTGLQNTQKLHWQLYPVVTIRILFQLIRFYLRKHANRSDIVAFQ